MHPSDLAELKARIETALAASATEFGTDTRAKHGPTQYAVDFEATACHLVNEECTRQVLTDPAVKRLGGRHFSIAVDNDRITIQPGAAPVATQTANKV